MNHEAMKRTHPNHPNDKHENTSEKIISKTVKTKTK